MMPHINHYTDEERINWLAQVAMTSRTGVTIEYLVDMEGESKRFRVDSFHSIGPMFPDIRAAIDYAMFLSKRMIG